MADGKQFIAQAVQTLIGAGAGFRGVDAAANAGAAVIQWTQAKQPFAFHIGTQADGTGEQTHQVPGPMGFAGAGNAVGDEQKRCWWLSQGVRQLQIGLAADTGCGAFHMRQPGLAGLDCVDFGAHHGPVDLVTGQQRYTAKVAAVFEIDVQQPLSERAGAMAAQVHEQEGQIVDDVDPAQFVVELDTVKDRNLVVVAQQQIAQMQITVAFADPAAGLAFGQAWPQAFGRCQGPVFQGMQLFAPGRISQPRSDVGKVVQHGLAHPFRGAKRQFGTGDGNAAMKRRQPAGQGVDVACFQLPGGQHPVEQRSLREAAHAHRVFDGRRDAGPWLLWTAADGHAIQVQFGCETAVQAQFFHAVVMTTLQAGKIQKTQI